jgi:hypothetical protein
VRGCGLLLHADNQLFIFFTREGILLGQSVSVFICCWSCQFNVSNLQVSHFQSAPLWIVCSQLWTYGMLLWRPILATIWWPSPSNSTLRNARAWCLNEIELME